MRPPAEVVLGRLRASVRAVVLVVVVVLAAAARQLRSKVKP